MIGELLQLQNLDHLICLGLLLVLIHTNFAHRQMMANYVA